MTTVDFLNEPEKTQEQTSLHDELVVLEGPDQEVISQVVAKLHTIFDPEIPVNIYDLGLIYKISISAQNDVIVEMTLTAPGCPVAQTFPNTVESTILQLETVNSATVILVWEPAWTQDRMSEAAKLQLGLL